MKFFKIPLALLVSLLFIEFISFFLLLSIDIYRFDFKRSLDNRLRDFKATYFYKPERFGFFDPVSQFWPKANSIVNGQKKNVENGTDQLLSYNKYGFLDNKNDYNSTNTFPEKNSSLFRIILIGGSSALGAPGNYDNLVPSRKTIASILERKLNQNNFDQPYQNFFFQVLNFGQIGGWSGNNLSKVMQYLIHLDPDMIIAYNGYNDALMGDSQGQPYLNWNYISYPNYIKNNVGEEYILNKIERNKFFPFTSSLINVYFDSKFYKDNLESKIQKLKSNLEKDNPIPKLITDYVASKDISDTKPIFIKNVKMLSAILSNEKIYYINYLQPSKQYENFILHNDNLNDNFPDKINTKIMDSYVDFFSELLSSNKNKFIKFSDKTKIFLNIKDNPYQPDGFHLTPVGNEIIAEQFFLDIVEILQ